MRNDEINIAMSMDFFKSTDRIPNKIKTRVWKTFDKLRADPTSAGLHCERLEGNQDPSLRSIRIDGT